MDDERQVACSTERKAEMMVWWEKATSRGREWEVTANKQGWNYKLQSTATGPHTPSPWITQHTRLLKNSPPETRQEDEMKHSISLGRFGFDLIWLIVGIICLRDALYSALFRGVLAACPALSGKSMAMSIKMRMYSEATWILTLSFLLWSDGLAAQRPPRMPRPLPGYFAFFSAGFRIWHHS